MKPDVTINEVSMLSLGWLRETVNFPTPQSQSNTITVPGRNSPIRFTEAALIRWLSQLRCAMILSSIWE